MRTPSATHLRMKSTLAVAAVGFGLAGLLSSSVLAQSGQPTPSTATLKEWDVYAFTGSRNVATILLDSTGTSNPTGTSGKGGSLWVATYLPITRLGRLDPNATVSNYVEWRPLSDLLGEGGFPLGLALNRNNGDVWMSIQGYPAFVIKLGGVADTFRKFTPSAPLVPQGIVTASDNALIAALPSGIGGPGDAIIRVPRDATPDPVSGALTATATVWTVGGGPRDVAVDVSGKIWFTEYPGNKLGRLDPTTGVVTEWPLPAGTHPAGLQLGGGNANTICVVSEGVLNDRSGIEQCLNIATNEITQYAIAMTNRGFDLPQHTSINADGETFITEQNGSSIAFVAYDGLLNPASIATVPPLPARVVLPDSTPLTFDVTDIVVTPFTFTIGPTVKVIPADVNPVATGIVRFPLPGPLNPQPVSLTPVVNDQGRNTGVVFFGEYFNGPATGPQLGGRVARFDLPAPAPNPAKPVILTNPTSVQFAAESGSPAPATQTISISEANGLPLNWTAAKTQSWLTLSPTSGTSGVTPSSLSLTVNLTGKAPGTYSDTITIDDGAGGAAPVTVPVTLTLTARPTIARSPASLAFTAYVNGGQPPDQTVSITNTGGGTLDWTATPSQPWIILSSLNGTAPSDLTVSVDPSSFTTGGTRTGTITITSPNATNSPQAVAVSLNMSQNAPLISISPTAMTFTVTKGATAPQSQTLTITNTGSASLSWQAVANQPAWLSATPPAGTLAAGLSTTTAIAIDPSTLTQPQYTGTITVTDINASNSPQTLTVTVNVAAAAMIISPTSFNVSAVENGANPPNQTLTVSNGGNASLPYTSLVQPGSSWLTIASGGSGNVAAGSSAPMALAINISSLTPGTYQGRVDVTDTSGASQKQTATVNLTITSSSTPPPTTAVISLSPARLDVFVAVGNNPPVQTIILKNTGTVALAYTAVPTTQNSLVFGVWLDVSPPAGTVAPGSQVTLSVTITSNTLQPGSYRGDITFTGNASNSPQSTPVYLTVGPGPPKPIISLNPSALTFTTQAGTSPASQTIIVNNTGNAPLNFSAAASTTSGGLWLKVLPTAGTVPAAGSKTVTVSVSSSALAPGTYTGSITVSDPNASNSPQSTSVTLTVTGSPTISLTPASLTFTTTGGQNPAAQQITVRNTGNAPLSFSAAASTTNGGAWLTVSPVSGTVAPGASTPLTVSVNSAALAAGTYTGHITVSDPKATNSPQSTSVTLTVGAPTISLTPASLTFTTKPGQSPAAQQITVRNTGNAPLSFSAAASTTNGGAWLTVSPVSGTVAAGGSTLLTVSVNSAALAAGTYSGRITVSDPKATNSPQSTSVTLSVTSATQCDDEKGDHKQSGSKIGGDKCEQGGEHGDGKDDDKNKKGDDDKNKKSGGESKKDKD